MQQCQWKDTSLQPTNALQHQHTGMSKCVYVCVHYVCRVHYVCVFTVSCSLCRVHYVMFTMLCSLCRVHYVVFTMCVHYVVFTMSCSLCRVHCVLFPICQDVIADVSNSTFDASFLSPTVFRFKTDPLYQVSDMLTFHAHNWNSDQPEF